MHELPVTQSILDIVVKHARMSGVKKIHAVNLAVGELSDLQDEWIQRYFDYISKGTLAEGARLVIERIPVVFRCSACSKEFQANVKEMKDITCPQCSQNNFELVSGREYHIRSMEAE